MYFKEKGKFYEFKDREITPFILNDILGENKNFGIIFGLPYSGKTFLAKHLAKNHGYELIDAYKDLVRRVKNSKKTPDLNESIAEEEITVTDLANEALNLLVNPANKTKKFTFDNLVNPILNSYDNVKLFLNKIGTPSIFYHVKCEDKTLRLRYKKILNPEANKDDLNEDEMTEYNNKLELPLKILEEIRQTGVKEIEVNCTEDEATSGKTFESIFGKKIIIIKHDYSKVKIDCLLSNYAAEYQALYINLPKLIYEKFYENKLWAKELKALYAKKTCVTNFRDYENLGIEEKIYYQYNPIHFENEVVLKLLKSHIIAYSKQYEKSGLIIITGLLNNHLLDQETRKYTLPIQDIKNIFDLGEFHAYYEITNSEIEIEEKLEEVLKEKPKVEKKKKKADDDFQDDDDGGDKVDGIDNMEGVEGEMEMEGEDGEKKPYNPFGKAWTNYNGQPRNYIQILLRQCNKTLKYLNGKSSVDLALNLSEDIKEVLLKNQDRYKDIVLALYSN